MLALSRALVIGALILGADGAVRAEEPLPPPLQESKQALRQLQKEQGERATEGTGGLRGALPSINAPALSGPGIEPLQPAATARQRQMDEAAAKRRAETNWLVDGMLRLEGRNAKSAIPGGGEVEEKLDPSDPDFLLKTYLREQRASKESEKRAPRDAAHANNAADPMAPFLREWLSGSPVEKAALGELADKPGARGNSQAAFPGEILAMPMSGTNQVGAMGDGVRSTLGAVPGGGEPAAANPFLPGLDFGGFGGSGGGPETLPVNSLPTTPPAPLLQPVPMLNPPAEAPRTTRQNDRKPPPSPLKENDKFFPQQKKF